MPSLHSPLVVVGASGAPAFTNVSWVAATGYQPPAFWLDPGGMVHLRGVVGTTFPQPPGNTIFTLPFGFRPRGIELFAGMAVVTSAVIIMDISVDSAGGVTFTAQGGGGSFAPGTYLSLSGIGFITDA